MKKILILTLSILGINAHSQQKVMTKELLWQLGRVSPIGLSEDGKYLYYKVGTPDVGENKINTAYYSVSIDGKRVKNLENADGLVADKNTGPGNEYVLSHEEVKITKVLGKDYYEGVEKSDVYIYDELDYRHWDTWNNGTFNHVILTNKKTQEKIDLLKDEPYHSPQKPFGGDEDYIWSPDGKKVIYVSKKKFGTAYALSTNTDLYEYDIDTKQTKNLTESNPGYDTHPSFSPNGDLTWLQMKHDGYEADKNDIIVRHRGMDINLTAAWDGTVDSYVWSKDGKKIYFTAPVDGTVQLFEVNFPGVTKIAVNVKQLTKGDFDVTGIVGFVDNRVILTRTDFNTATEVFSYDLKSKKWLQITHVNDALYAKIGKSKFQKRYVTTTDGKKMLVWVILPPNFDPNKKYPTLLYCQGGPQSALTQFYSFRWNFQLIAAEGYIIVAPNRRGMPGFGVEWNEAISKDWGGQPMQDYLTAIDEVSKEPYVDSKRLGAIGASYGGYSIYYLAGIHQNRFKSFIAHCGVFDLESMYGTTEEVFFTNWDSGGPYWEKDNAVARKTYAEFNPKNKVANWNTPILIFHGGIDYRVPIGQGQEAFQAAQLLGIKSRFVYFPDENHWVTKPQNAKVWQGEFFRWLKETL
ncbi:S9 family peptidase [Myroides ceti]|uniref:S9 family peptidase n=1 Tax=Paenimyroides ceti TaxID=395087 RepID=A0ABT8CQ10_9FLAO|nr:S9 family peptidase [Paenimyroides ceti]MDN3705743.1 S9 family peptidase [Paenimyroides ceti]MDN3709107.1 S9 family peptidase [Paenimyroides ceti]